MRANADTVNGNLLTQPLLTDAKQDQQGQQEQQGQLINYTEHKSELRQIEGEYQKSDVMMRFKTRDNEDLSLSLGYEEIKISEINPLLFFDSKAQFRRHLSSAKARDRPCQMIGYFNFIVFAFVAMAFGGIYSDDLLLDFFQSNNYEFLGLFGIIIIPQIMLSAKWNHDGWRKIYLVIQELFYRPTVNKQELLLNLMNLVLPFQVVGPSALVAASIAYCKLQNRKWPVIPLFSSCSLFSTFTINLNFVWDWVQISLKKGIHQVVGQMGYSWGKSSRQKILLEYRLKQLIREVNSLAENHPYRFLWFAHELFRKNSDSQLYHASNLRKLQRINPEILFAEIAAAFPKDLLTQSGGELSRLTKILCELTALFYSSLLIYAGKNTLPDFAEAQPQLMQAFSLLLNFLPLTTLRLQVYAICSMLTNLAINRQAVTQVVLVFMRWRKTSHFNMALFIKGFLALSVGIYAFVDAWKNPLFNNFIVRSIQALLAFMGGSFLARFSLMSPRISMLEHSIMLTYLDTFSSADFAKDMGVVKMLDTQMQDDVDFHPAVRYFQCLLVDIILPDIRCYLLALSPDPIRIKALVLNENIKQFKKNITSKKQSDSQERTTTYTSSWSRFWWFKTVKKTRHHKLEEDRYVTKDKPSIKSPLMPKSSNKLILTRNLDLSSEEESKKIKSEVQPSTYATLS